MSGSNLHVKKWLLTLLRVHLLCYPLRDQLSCFTIVVEYHYIVKELRALKCLLEAYMFKNAYLSFYMFISHVISYVINFHVLPS